MTLFSMIDIRGKELYLGDFVKNMFNVGFCSTGNEPVFFQAWYDDIHD